jgi:hypothetical protein
VGRKLELRSSPHPVTKKPFKQYFHVGLLVDKMALGQVFSKYFGFPCQFSFHHLLHTHHRQSPWADTIGQLVAGVPNGLVSSDPKEKENTYIPASICVIHTDNEQEYYTNTLGGES